MSNEKLLIRVEHFRYHVQLDDDLFPTIEEAARAAWTACEWNTSWYGTATHIETGETWNRRTLLDLGFDALTEEGNDE